MHIISSSRKHRVKGKKIKISVAPKEMEGEIFLSDFVVQSLSILQVSIFHSFYISRYILTIVM